jgi:hypothetical protein
VTPEFFQAREWDVASGRLITPGRCGRAAKVAVLGLAAAEHLLVGGARADGPGQESAVSWWPGWSTLVGSYELPLRLCIIDGIVTEVLEGGLGEQAGRRRGYELRGQGAVVPNRGSRLGL